MDIILKFKEFKFTKEFIFKGVNKITESGWKKVKLVYHLDKKGQKLINQHDRSFKFHFTLQLFPDIGEVNLDGECIVESPNQDKIEICMRENITPIIKFIDTNIIKNCIINSKKIFDKNKLPIPPVNIIFEKLKLR